MHRSLQTASFRHLEVSIDVLLFRRLDVSGESKVWYKVIGGQRG